MIRGIIYERRSNTKPKTERLGASEGWRVGEMEKRSGETWQEMVPY